MIRTEATGTVIVLIVIAHNEHRAIRGVTGIAAAIDPIATGAIVTAIEIGTPVATAIVIATGMIVIGGTIAFAYIHLVFIDRTQIRESMETTGETTGEITGDTVTTATTATMAMAVISWRNGRVTRTG
jgi:hypothetical protein